MMVRITESLVRKSAEHNECVISTLEEVALHQRDIEKIEYLDKWCRELKILDLTSNLIPKIENLGRLKKLEYLKLGLNNIEKIENLGGCESLTKLDLTVNFIGELTSVESLSGLEHLRELYLTGNPCTKFEGYRQFVVASLPQLEKLDGVEITKSERILAFQVLEELRSEIIQQQRRHKIIREKEKLKEEEKLVKDESIDPEERERRFWNETTAFTPESRTRIYNHKQNKNEEKNKIKPETPTERKLVTNDGRRINVNEPKLKFELTEDEEGNNLILDIALFRFLDTSLCSVDVHPTYVQVIVKGKILQLVLPEEINSEKSLAQRSQASGRLIITMPKINPQRTYLANFYHCSKKSQPEHSKEPSRIEKLEVDPSCRKTVRYDNICKEHFKRKTDSLPFKSAPKEKKDSEDFVDDDQVPPLESI